MYEVHSSYFYVGNEISWILNYLQHNTVKGCFLLLKLNSWHKFLKCQFVLILFISICHYPEFYWRFQRSMSLVLIWNLSLHWFCYFLNDIFFPRLLAWILMMIWTKISLNVCQTWSHRKMTVTLRKFFT